MGIFAQEAEGCFASAGRAAVADLARLPDVEKYFSVYFWLGDVPPANRPRFILALAGHCNALSREPVFYFPQIVLPDMSLVRVNYGAYGWTNKVIQQLIEANPYRTEDIKLLAVPWHGGTWPGDGQTYQAGSFTYNRVIPLVGARFFIWQTLAQKNRIPGYYDFLGINNRDDYEKLVGISKKLAADGKRFDKIEVSVRSGVSDQMRNIVIRSALDGSQYVTEDSEQAIKTKNPVRITARDFFEHDVEEHIGFSSNGMMVSFLGSAAGVRQDVAPGYLSDKLSPTNDKQIHVGVSCYRCHYRQWQDVHGRAVLGSAGLIDATEHFRSIANQFPTASPDYDRIKEFEKLYLRPFRNQLTLSRLAHNVAVIECTGMVADEWAARLTQAFEEYDYGATLAEAAAFFGCDEKVAGKIVQGTLARYAKETGLLDPVLVLFARGESIPRLQYHEVFHSLFATWQGMKIHAKAIPDVLVPAPDADSRKLKLLLPKLQLPGVSAAGGLQQHVLPAIRHPAVHGGIRTANGGNQRQRGLPAGNYHAGYGGSTNPGAVHSARRPGGGSPATTAIVIRATAGPPNGHNGSESRDSGAVATASVAARPSVPATLFGVPHGGVGKSQLPTVRSGRDVPAANAGDGWQRVVPHQHELPEATHAAQWEPAIRRPQAVDRRHADTKTTGAKAVATEGGTTRTGPQEDRRAILAVGGFLLLCIVVWRMNSA